VYYRTAAPTWRRTMADAMLSALATRPAVALASPVSLHLFEGAPISITPDTGLAAFTAQETAFSGYAAAVLTTSAPVRGGQLVEAVLASALFVATTASPFVTGNVTGYFLVSGSDWVLAEQFPPGTVGAIASPGDFLDIDVAVPLSLAPTF
jgi:hypothetical protein